MAPPLLASPHRSKCRSGRRHATRPAPLRGAVAAIAAWWCTAAVEVLGQGNVSAGETGSNESNGTGVTDPSDFNASEWEIVWPACPTQGCLPCPDNATGRPFCACLEGFSLDGEPVPGGAQVPIPWSTTFGWQGVCHLIRCEETPTFPYADPVGDIPVRLLYAQRASFMCQAGYYVDSGSRTIELECGADGNLTNRTLTMCVPFCGDGRLMPLGHLPDGFEPREECDDGNINDNDGCSRSCAVDVGFVCHGGSPSSADRCTPAGVFLISRLVIEISGRRLPSDVELHSSAKAVIAFALGCPERDIEISDVESVATVAEYDTDRVRFHPVQLNAVILFRVKVSDPEVLSVDELYGALDTPKVMRPKLQVGYATRTTLADVYVQVIEIAPPTIEGDVTLGRPPSPWTLSGLLDDYMYVVVGGFSYCCMISCFVPTVYWMIRARQRESRLIGRYDDMAPEFKGAWAFNICSWLENKTMCMALVCYLPARMAYTWDSVGIMSYWLGVRQALCCCTMYFFGCCLCGAIIPAAARSEMRQILGFKNSKLGLADYCAYLCCPICCVIQEAKHVDAAVKWLPRVFKSDYSVYTFDEETAPGTMDMVPVGAA